MGLLLNCIGWGTNHKQRIEDDLFSFPRGELLLVWWEHRKRDQTFITAKPTTEGTFGVTFKMHICLLRVDDLDSILFFKRRASGLVGAENKRVKPSSQQNQRTEEHLGQL